MHLPRSRRANPACSRGWGLWEPRDRSGHILFIDLRADVPDTFPLTTGAGWGGCTVSLVDETQVDAFIAKIKAGYGPYLDLGGEELQQVIFATKPSSGVCGTSTC